MSLGILALVVVSGIALVVILVRLSDRGREGSEEADAGTALIEFGSAFPGEAIRAVIMTADKKASFFRLAEGRTGFLQTMGRHSIARLIEPEKVSVAAHDSAPALKIDFGETAFTGGTYRFASQEDASEVSLWLCGAFAKAAGAEEANSETRHDV